MGGSRYIRLRILLACYILAILAPTTQFSPERSPVPTESLGRNWLLDSAHLISKHTTPITNSSNTLLTDFSSKSHHNLWTLRYQRGNLGPHSPNILDNLWLHWVQTHTLIHKKAYGCFESYVILLYVFYTYCYACAMRVRDDNSMSRDEDVIRPTSRVFSLLVSKLTTEENKGKSTSGLSDDPSKQYDWIFKYPNTLWNKTVSVYPVFQPESWQRIASYSKLAFQKVSEKVSFVQLAGAGFRYMEQDLVVTCDECNKSLNISDFTSSPCEAKYHEDHCRFIEPVDRDAVLMGDSFPFSSAPDATKSSLAKTPSLTQGYNTAPVQTAHEIQTSGQSQQSLTADQPPSSTSTFIHGAGSNEVENTSNIPGFSCSGSSSGSPLSHDIENDGHSALLQPLAHINGCPDQTNGPVISPQVPSEIRPQQQQHVAQGAAGISRHEASAVSAVDSGQTHTSNTSNSRPTNQQQQNHSATNGSGRMTTPAGSQEPPKPGSSGASCSSNTHAEFVDIVDFKPEVDEADTEVRQSDDNCPKNPGHYSYFPTHNLRLEYIPSNVRCPDVLRFFNLIAKLTVRVVVSAISSKRLRLCPPNHQTKYKFGTGFAVSKPSGNYSNIEHSEKLTGVRKYLPYGRKNGYIYIETSRHLVRDNADAENTTVEFLYDQPNRRGVIVAKGVSVCHSCDLGDSKSILVCRTSDVTLVKMVKDSNEEMENIAKSFPQNIKEGMMRRIFMFSHPHGAEKVFSFGEYVIVKYRLETITSDGRVVTKFVKINNHTQISQNDNDVRKLMMYTADTCPGSTGGVIVSFKKTGTADAGDIVLDLWMHNGFDVKHSLNTSAMKAVTSDDIANHGHQSVYRPSIQEDMAAEAERAANQVVHSPVFTVTQPPCHPAYVTYRKRWESYPAEFTHIHTKEALANAGFFYAGYSDCVRCFQCGLGLKSWRNGDVINQEHFKNRPDCQFLLLKLRESGINVSQLGAQVRPSVNQSAEPSHATSNAELGLGENTPRQTEETKIMMQVVNEPNITNTEAKTLITQTEEKTPDTQTEKENCITDVINDTTHLQPGSQEGMVYHVQSLPSETKGPAAVSATDVARLLEKEQRYLKQIFICKVCCKNQVKDLFLPCGELVACVDCSKLLTHCPSCNKKILATVTTYFS